MSNAKLTRSKESKGQVSEIESWDIERIVW